MSRLAMNLGVVLPPIANYPCIIANTEQDDLLLLKESAHIQLKDEQQKINRDEGENLRKVWILSISLVRSAPQ